MTDPRIAILGNCQAPLWRDALGALLPEAEVVSSEHVGLGGRTLADAAHDAASLEPTVVIVISEFARREDELSALHGTEVIVVPSIVFSAFHPDLAYVRTDDGVVANGLGLDWNSRLLRWSFDHGLTPDDALRLFTSEVFESMGYLDAWAVSEAALRRDFEACGLDLDRWLRTVKRSGVFMHGINHPRPIAVAAACQQVVESRLQRTPVPLGSAAPYLPDRLAQQIVWPVHRPVAERLGLDPLERVKVRDSLVGWEDFAHACFGHWQSLPHQPIRYVPAMGADQDAALMQVTGATG